MGLKKYVLTGGPCSGKTTLINALKERGFPVIEEIAREFLKNRRVDVNDRKEYVDFCRDIFSRQIVEEENLSRFKPQDAVFLDRGLADSLGYLNYFRYSDEFFDKRLIPGRYDAVFVLDRLPFIDDGLRIEKGDDEADKIHENLIEAYSCHGYNPIRVPVMPVKHRVDFILDYVRNGG